MYGSLGSDFSKGGVENKVEFLVLSIISLHAFISSYYYYYCEGSLRVRMKEEEEKQKKKGSKEMREREM